MELYKILYYFLSFFSLLVINFCLTKIRYSHKNLPPSPPAIPILGHLYLFKPPMHRIFHSLAQKYGPIISLQFGSRLVVVISSQHAIEECFTRNDIILANRPKFLVGKHVAYDNSTVVQAPYGDHWRNLRRIGAIEIFSTHRINTFLSTRKDEIKRLIIKLCHQSVQDFAKVELKSLFQEMTFNIMMRMIAGKRYYGDEVSDEEEARRFRKLIKQAAAYGGASNREDFWPILNWIDGGDFERRVKRLGKEMDKFLQKLIDEHRIKKERLESMNTMIDHLLSLQESQPEYYTDEIIKGFILVALLAGTDTSAVTLEWALSNLLNHPYALKKAVYELDHQVGQDRLLDEPDLSKLHYLQNIVSETLRLYPAAPILLPHMASDNCTVGGYNVPRDTILLVNAWATHRDPMIWDDPSSFKPERFDNVDEMGHKLMSFGLGRRSCPGAALAQRVVRLTLGTLIQCFDWKRLDDKEIDMTEGRGGTMPKLKPLEALCKARPIVSKIVP